MKWTLSATLASVLPLVAHFGLGASGAHLTPQSYALPTTVGAVMGFLLGFVLDRYRTALTSLARANQALQEEVDERTRSEERYAALFEKNHSIILLIDPASGAIVDANPRACEYYGYSIAEMKALKIFDINTLTEAEVRTKLNEASHATRTELAFEHRLASGETRDVQCHTGPIELDGKPVMLSIINDVTELKMLRGIIPICAHCKQIRDDEGYWNQLESYMEKHFEASFSHGICPRCLAEHFADELEDEPCNPAPSASRSGA